MENASAAFLIAVKRRMRDVRRAFGQDTVEPATLTAAERIQYDGWKRRTAEEATTRALHAEGVGVKEIVRRTGRSRKLVSEVVRGGRTEPFRSRGHSLEPWLERLNAEWTSGCRNGAELWRRLRAAGSAGSQLVVTEWATRRRRADMPGAPSRCPAPRALARLLTTASDKLSRTEAVIVATAEGAVPALVAARGVTDAFDALIRGCDAASLDAWIETALASPLESFAKGVATDRSAIAAAIETPWSNGKPSAETALRRP